MERDMFYVFLGLQLHSMGNVAIYVFWSSVILLVVLRPYFAIILSTQQFAYSTGLEQEVEYDASFAYCYYNNYDINLHFYLHLQDKDVLNMNGCSFGN